ncbi:hypothetical protein JRO89_XS08G0146600 [Xanthoceras sorbifolium]|uniref:Uncharacterized protein n=1 Tax=Xanthoceras sorbifolium TaxID=99658 RepID=A0ABQ8HPU7_9ROSI|nr:hypothetical protein JRO89_XS08G0146600 [Xanthoceras sorbifolium]
MNDFDFGNGADGGASSSTTHQSYDWLGSLSRLVYRLELLGALVFLCCLVYCIPIAAEFLRRLSAFVSAPPFDFVFFNVVVVVIALSVKFGVFSAADCNVSAKENAGNDKQEEEVVQLLREEVPGKSFFENLNDDDGVVDKAESLREEEVPVLEEEKEVIVCKEKAIPTPTTTMRDTNHEVGVLDSQEEYEHENPVDELSCEEFNKKIENFIENMRTFRRQESWLESLMENNRTSIAVFD